MDEIIYIPLATTCFRTLEGTLTGNSLLPQREQILSCQSTFLSLRNEVEESVPPMHATPFHSMF